MPDPLWMNSVTLDAGELRRAQALVLMPAGAALSGRQGVRPGGGLDVSVSSGTITVTPGAALVHGVTAVTQGAYWWALDTNWTNPLTAAHATLGRRDIVYIRVRDSDVDTSGAQDCAPVYQVGTASSTPVTPTPAAGTSYLSLAVITVPSVASGQQPSVDMSVRPYTVAAGGVLPVANAAGLAAIAGVYPGMTAYQIDSGTTLRSNGSVWRDVVERHVVTMNKAGVFSLPSNAWAWVVWDGTTTQTDPSMWTSGAATRLYFPRTGAWLVTAAFTWPTGAQQCRLRVRTNGSADWQAQPLAVSPGTGTTETARVERWTAGDYIEIGILHDTGSTLTGLAASLLSVGAVWVHP